MSVRAKMQCSFITNWFGVDGLISQVTVKLTAVVGNTEDNKEWSKWTPSGELTLTITNPDAFKQFEGGKSYLIDVSPAD